MLREPSRHDGLPNNQAARDRDRQRERQRQERAQMLVSDDTGVTPNIQDLFNAPVKVNPSIEDPTSIEIRKTFGSYDSARPFLTEKNGALQGRLIGVDQTLNAATASGGGTSSGVQISHSSSGESSHRGQAGGGGISSGHKPPGIPPPRPPQPPTATNSNTTKPDFLSLFKHIPPASQTQPAASHLPPLPSLHAIGPVPNLNHIQNSIIGAWSLPTPLSPFPVRKQTKLSTTTLPITFVNTSSLNTLSAVTSEIGEHPKQPSKTNHNNYQSTATTVNSTKPLGTSISNSGLTGQSELKSVANPSASLGAPTTEKSNPQLTYKKPLERNDSRVELDDIIREMTDVGSPLAAILPKDSPPKKVAIRRSSKSDERTIEALEAIHELKNSLSPLSGMNSSSSSSGSDSSDSDSDTDSSSGSELTTPSNTPIKNPPPTTTRSPTERQSWSLSSFVGGIPKENALIEAASTSLDPKAANTNLETLIPSSESSKNSKKAEHNVSPSSTTGGVKHLSNPNSIFDSSKALIKPSGFIKPSVPQNKLNSKDAGSHSKGSVTSAKSGSENKGKVLPVLTNLNTSLPKVSSALLKHKDPTLSGSSSEDDEPPLPPPPPKEKEKGKISPKTKAPAKRPATTTATEAPAKKRLRRNSIKPPSPLVPSPIIPVAEKGGPKGDEKQGKSLDRNKNDMIGRLFRPKKDKSDEGGKDKEIPSTSVTPREEKSGKSKGKSPPVSNRVSGKDSGRKSNSSTGIGTSSASTATNSVSATTKTNGELKPNAEKHETKLSNTFSSTSSSKSKRSTSPAKGTHQKVSGSCNSIVGTTAEKPDKSKHHSSTKSKKNGESTSPSPKAKRVSGSTRSLPSPKTKKSSEPPTKSKPAARTKTEPPIVPKSSSTSLKATKPTPNSSKSNTSSSKSAAKSMPPPPPPPSSHPSTLHKESKSNKKDDKVGLAIKSPTSLIVRIPINMLPRMDKVTNKKPEPQNSIINAPKKSEGKASREDKKVEGRPKAHFSLPSLVGSSVEDVTDTHNVPSKTVRGSGGSDQTTPSNERSSSRSPSNRKRSRNRPHSSSKKPRLKEMTEVDIKAGSEKNLSCDLSSSALTPYTGGATAAKTPPDPPDSSLNPTHSSSPTLALPQQPVYASYFEKVEHQEDYFAFDQAHYLDQAKNLKHRADKEEYGVPQILMYMDSSLYFILSGILMERTIGKVEAYAMYKQTISLIRQISARPRMSIRDDPQETKLLVLALRIQSLLSYQLYKFQAPECIDASRYLTDYFHSKTSQEYLTPHPTIRSPQTSLSTPSPHSPGLSPAGSGPASVGSTPSIHSPHHQSHQQIAVSKHLYQKLSRYCLSSHKLVHAHDTWDTADVLVEQNNVQDFFIPIDRLYGPLTMHSSLLDLVRYVRCGLKVLNQNLLDSS